MDILTHLPTDSFVTAAFAELLDDVGGLLKAAREQKPCDKDEIKFWTAQFNALNKAEYNHKQGTRIVISDRAYLLPSASRPGALVHRLTRAGGILICSCEAGAKGTLCWHHVLVNVAERAAEMESLSHKDAELVSGGGDPTPSPIPHHAAAATWLGGQQLLASRLTATAHTLDAMRTAQGRTASPDAPRRLGLRLVEARKKSAYFASAFYLAA